MYPIIVCMTIDTNKINLPIALISLHEKKMFPLVGILTEALWKLMFQRGFRGVSTAE